MSTQPWLIMVSSSVSFFLYPGDMSGYCFHLEPSALGYLLLSVCVMRPRTYYQLSLGLSHHSGYRMSSHGYFLLGDWVSSHLQIMATLKSLNHSVTGKQTFGWGEGSFHASQDSSIFVPIRYVYLLWLRPLPGPWSWSVCGQLCCSFSELTQLSWQDCFIAKSVLRLLFSFLVLTELGRFHLRWKQYKNNH